MKTLVVYDSVYGNTEKIAKAIVNAITGEAKVLCVSEVNSSEFNTFDLLIVGSSTHGGKPTRGVQAFLKEISLSALKSARWRRSIFDFSMKLVGISRLCRRKNR